MSTAFRLGVRNLVGSQAFDLYQVLKGQPSFYTLASCFDQCKLREAWVRIVVDTINPPAACAEGRSPLLAVAWDRNGVSEE